ncbi:Venom protein [Caenorhabditis elegans]|uniref:Venom protein n=1 Tax=Caenorhabditis elegans TaxID=6239 RepID=H2L277_CAEEL|nr:Venom protein [Caenorhabditis elegans]CCE72342.1 Venom protein [Caenorhabditis elegans]|eukprot:NP_001254143.1 Uncharacterized protein CELE_T05C12.15 [Caenorhabditis elegans]
MKLFLLIFCILASLVFTEAIQTMDLCRSNCNTYIDTNSKKTCIERCGIVN